jgi:hypothetical protein
VPANIYTHANTIIITIVVMPPSLLHSLLRRLPDDALRQLAHTPPKLDNQASSVEKEELAAVALQAEADVVAKQAAALQLDAGAARCAHVVQSLLVITVSSSSKYVGSLFVIV